MLRTRLPKEEGAGHHKEVHGDTGEETQHS